ncbi:MAG: DNA-binding protein [Gammaproteobacteria bacterium]|nr:DNA-binding protein [Gammaproteobacteria bacterium]
MPLYTVSTKKPVSELKKLSIVKLITEAHCLLTGAPANYVQVVFAQGIPLPRKTAFHVLGSIRSGRSDAIKAQICQKITSALSSLDTKKRATEVMLIDVPASWIMEGGEIMPEPEQDKAS